MDTSVLGIDAARAKEEPFIASMGIYVFKKDVLVDLLNKEYPTALDFGGEIIPSAAQNKKVIAYAFDGYWEDIGTIKSFFEENLKLARQVWGVGGGGGEIMSYFNKSELYQTNMKE